MLSGLNFRKFIFLLVFLRSTCIAANCTKLGEPCSNDCDCCYYHTNYIRCDVRNKILGKRCYRAVPVSQPCSTNSDCLSQNCINRVCAHNNRPTRPPVGYRSVDPGDDNALDVVYGDLFHCSCQDKKTLSANNAMDGDLTTDYINYHSLGYSGLIVEPRGFMAPVRMMEVCTSSRQNDADDPLCYRLEGYCRNDDKYMFIREGKLPLTTARRDCLNVTIDGRQSYSRYKILFGCRRGGFVDHCDSAVNLSHETVAEETVPRINLVRDTESPPTPLSTETTGGGNPARLTETTQTYPCYPSKANCPEVTPLGKDSTCAPLITSDGSGLFNEFSPFFIIYDEENDVTKHTYSYQNTKWTDLSHAILQYIGGCCIHQIRVYSVNEDGTQNTVHVVTSPGNYLQSPKPSVCMSGIDVPGVVGTNTFFYELTIDGHFPHFTMGDYVLTDGQHVKYAKTFLPECRCDIIAPATRRNFRGLQLGQYLRKQRRLERECVNFAVSISEVKLFGKHNEG